MADIKGAFVASQSLTITLDSLASSGARQSAAFDNTTGAYLDAEATITVVAGGAAPSSDKCANVWGYYSEDGTNFLDNATGSDASITLNSPTNFKGPYTIVMPTASLTYRGMVSVAELLGLRQLPRKFGFVIENRHGQAFGTGCGITLTLRYRTVA